MLLLRTPGDIVMVRRRYGARQNISNSVSTVFLVAFTLNFANQAMFSGIS